MALAEPEAVAVSVGVSDGERDVVPELEAVVVNVAVGVLV